MPRPVEIPADLKRGPFAIADLRDRGLSRWVASGSRFRRIFKGIYVWAEIPDSLELRCRAALLLLSPGDRSAAVISHHSAARLAELPVPGEDALVVHLTVPRQVRGPQGKGVVVHHRPLGREVVTYHGLQVTSPRFTFCDLSTCLELVDLVVLGDAAVRAGYSQCADLIAAADAMKRHGRPLARRAAGLTRARVDSPMETRLRLLLVLAGLPCPEPNLAIYHPVTGDHVATVDLQYPEQKIVLEYDGDIHRTDRFKWRRDENIRRTLRDLDWDVHAFNADDIQRHPEYTLERVHRALTDRGHPHVPARLDPSWRQHFRTNRTEWWPSDEAGSEC